MTQVLTGVSLPNPTANELTANEAFSALFAAMVAAYKVQNHSEVHSLRQKLMNEFPTMVDAMVCCGADPRKIRTREEVSLALFFGDWLVCTVYDLAGTRCFRSIVREKDDFVQDVYVKLFRYFLSPRPGIETAQNMDAYINTSSTNGLNDAKSKQAKRDKIGTYTGSEDSACASGLNATHSRIRSKPTKKTKNPIPKPIPANFASSPIIITTPIPAHGAND